MSTKDGVVTSKEIKTQIRMQEYLNRAIYYYVFARKAVMLGVVPVGGSLFHTAIEMLLHCGLSIKYSHAQLKEDFSKHELSDIWLEFKSIFAKTCLLRFDKFVNNHRHWKELRYPMTEPDESLIFFGRTKPDPEMTRQNIASLHRHNICMEINLEEMDDFVAVVVQIIGINPDYVKIQFQHKNELLDFYLDQNLHPLFDDKNTIRSATFLTR